MTIAKGITKQLIYKKETTWGTPSGPTGGKLLRRVTSSFDLTKETYQSDEIRTDYQIADFRHGVRSADGSISGELSPGSYAELFAGILGKDFTAGVAITGVGLTIAGSGTVWTLTRDAGSYITDGFKVGDVIVITAGTGVAVGDLNKNLLITALTATVATVSVLNGSTMTAAPSATGVAMSVKGKKSFIPLTGHTFDSFTFEHWFADIAQSEVFSGCKMNTLGVSIPATGMATVDFALMGKDLASSGTSQYFTSPTAQSNTGVVAGVNGVVVFDGTPVAVITDASFNINRNLSSATVLGSNSLADMFEGRSMVDGSISLYFQDVVARNAFRDETEVSLIFTMTTSNAANADFVSFTLPRVKLGSFTKDDGETGLIASADFQALVNTSVTTFDTTTIVVQDSAA